MIKGLTISLLSMFVALLPSFAANAADSKGKVLFREKACAGCHGLVGQGGVGGPRLAPGPLPFDSFIQLVRAPRGEMPPFSRVILSDEEVRGIHAYLESIKPGPSAADIPALRERLPKDTK